MFVFSEENVQGTSLQGTIALQNIKIEACFKVFRLQHLFPARDT